MAGIARRASARIFLLRAILGMNCGTTSLKRRVLSFLTGKRSAKSGCISFATNFSLWLKIPRDVSGQQRVTVPDHDAIRIGTLNSILRAVSRHKGISRDAIIDLL